MATHYRHYLGILGQVGKMKTEGVNLREQSQSITWVEDWLQKLFS